MMARSSDAASMGRIQKRKTNLSKSSLPACNARPVHTDGPGTDIAPTLGSYRVGPATQSCIYIVDMIETSFIALSAWLTQAGLAGTSESHIVSGFCDRCVAAGLPLDRAVVFIDTLHPVHEGRLFRWGHGPDESALLEYGRTSPEALAASGSDPEEVAAAERWRRSPFYRMLQTGNSLLRLRLNEATKDEFAFLEDMFAAGMTDYVAIIARFAAEGTIGEMDGVYSAWATRAPDGFNDAQIAALQRIAPYLALAIKSVSLVRMTSTLMTTYLGRDAGQRVLGGRIMRGIAEQIDAVVWFNDLRGFTRITDTAPGTGHSIAERLLRCDLLSDPGARRRSTQVDRRRHAGHLHRQRPHARLQRGAVRSDRRAPRCRRVEKAANGRR